MLRPKTHISHREIVYSIYDPAIQQSNSKEVLEEYAIERDVSTITVPKNATKFVIGPLPATAVEELSMRTKIDPRVRPIARKLQEIRDEVMEEYGTVNDDNKKEWNPAAEEEFSIRMYDFMDTLDEVKRKLWETFEKREAFVNTLWLVGIESIVANGENYTVEEFLESIPATRLSKTRSELADLIARMSLLDDSLGK